MESINQQTNLGPQIALVIGAASGIGKAVALKFGSNGYRIVCADINSEGGQQTVKEIQALQNDLEASYFVEVDVTNGESVEKMVKTAIKKYKRIDACFNGAGIEGDRAKIAEYDEKMFDKVLNTNLKGMWLCLKYELKYLQEQEPRVSKYKGIKCRANIVNCSSTAGLYYLNGNYYYKGLGGMAEFSPYCCSKWGVLGLTKTVASEYISKGIRINAICPSTTDTPMVERFAQQWPEWQEAQNSSFKIGRIGQPEEIAETVQLLNIVRIRFQVLFLCSDKAPFIVGSQIILEGGCN